MHDARLPRLARSSSRSDHLPPAGLRRRTRGTAVALCAMLAVASAACARDHGTDPVDTSASRIVWRADGLGWGDAAFDDSSVYFVGWHHDLTAVDKATGQPRWHVATGESGEETYGRGVVAARTIVVMGDAELYAYNRDTGHLWWRYQPRGGWGTGLYFFSTDGNRVYTGSAVGRAYAVDVATGAQRWETDVADGDSLASIADAQVADGTVYVCVRHNTAPTRGGIVALDAATGAVRWSFTFPPQDANDETGCVIRLALAADVVVGAALDARLFAVDRSSGQLRWTAAPPDPSVHGLRPVAANGSIVVAGGATGYVTAFDADSGRVLWRATANLGSAIDPIGIDGQRAYVKHMGGQLAAFDLTNGSVLWVAGLLSDGGEFAWAPGVDSARLYIGGFRGLYALRKGP